MAVCKSCSQPLVLNLEPDDFDEATSSAIGGTFSTVPDDLQLACQCHFHWQCLLDEASTVAISLSCPLCNIPLGSQASGNVQGRSSAPQVITRYINEGGVQENLDILPLIIEEAYLNAHPEARPARAYMTMCSEGDVLSIIELLQTLQSDDDDDEDDEEASMSPVALLRYQDPLNGGNSALHAAIENGHQEVVWLLLWLASGLRTEDFPAEAVHTAQVLNASREFAALGPDVRGLRNEQGLTGGDLAHQIGGPWAFLSQTGIFG